MSADGCVERAYREPERGCVDDLRTVRTDSLG
jgi:hypothetical protein